MSATEGKRKGKVATDSKKRRKKVGGGDALDNDRSTIQKRRGLFSKDLSLMMYGFGDAARPQSDSIDLVEDIVVDYVTVMMQRAVDASAKRGKLETEDLIRLVRKDPLKFGRVKELMAADAEIKAAKKTFEEDDEIEQGKVAPASTATGS